MALSRIPAIDPAIELLALWCAHRDDDGPTRTAGDTILYGPDFEAKPLAEQTGLLAHHVLHVALRHSARMREMGERLGEGFDRNLFALACDALVNEALLESGHALPRPAVRATELLAEIGKPAQTVLAEYDVERLYYALIGDGRKGESADAAKRYAAARAYSTDVDPEDGEAAEIDGSPEVWALRLDQAWEVGRSVGAGVGAASSGLKDLPKSRVPWERRLRRLLNNALSEEPLRSWRRPANQWIARDAAARANRAPTPVFEPGQARGAWRPRIVIGIDASGSVSDAQFRLFAAETMGVARRCGAETHAILFDVEVQEVMRIDRPEALLSLSPRRGGGTDFAPCVAAATELSPSLLLILTDCDGPMGEAPEFPVLWAVPSTPVSTPPFGDLFTLHD